jgi:hypothetical protein
VYLSFASFAQKMCANLSDQQIFQTGVAELKSKTYVQDDQKVSVHLMITVQKTCKNILNSFNHLP